MCIRDSNNRENHGRLWELNLDESRIRFDLMEERRAQAEVCLLYTSDAADERSSVDLGGRRIIKKKKSI